MYNLTDKELKELETLEEYLNDEDNFQDNDEVLDLVSELINGFLGY